jgi:phage shock protein E
MKIILENIGLVLDVRTLDEWNAGHGKNSKLIPIDEIENRLQEIEIYKNKKIVVVCRSGSRAGRAVDLLKNKGYTNVSNGGAWENFK